MSSDPVRSELLGSYYKHKVATHGNEYSQSPQKIDERLKSLEKVSSVHGDRISKLTDDSKAISETISRSEKTLKKTNRDIKQLKCIYCFLVLMLVVLSALAVIKYL